MKNPPAIPVHTDDESGVQFADAGTLGFDPWGRKYMERTDLQGFDGGCVYCGRPTGNNPATVSVDPSYGHRVAVVREDTREAREGAVNALCKTQQGNCYEVGSTCHKRLKRALADQGLYLV